MAVLACLGITVVAATALAERGVRRMELHPMQTVTLTTAQFLAGEKQGPPATIAGELRLPSGVEGRLPAVVLVHGAAGVGAQVDPWAREPNESGIAVFIFDSFSGRGIGEGFVPEDRAGSLTMLVDAYRALELLANHPSIDPARIALMGFSRGGIVALYASLTRFQRLHGAAGLEFAAYLPFYPACWTTYLDDEQVSARPIRIFHGTADDWTPIEPCRHYVTRLRQQGKDIHLTEYPGAHHSFDAPMPLRQFPQATGLGTCAREERPGGLLVNRATGEPWKPTDACATKGTTAGGHPQARVEVTKAVKEFLTATFKLSQ